MNRVPAGICALEGLLDVERAGRLERGTDDPLRAHDPAPVALQRRRGRLRRERHRPAVDRERRAREGRVAERVEPAARERPRRPRAPWRPSCAPSTPPPGAVPVTAPSGRMIVLKIATRLLRAVSEPAAPPASVSRAASPRGPGRSTSASPAARVQRHRAPARAAGEEGAPRDAVAREGLHPAVAARRPPAAGRLRLQRDTTPRRAAPPRRPARQARAGSSARPAPRPGQELRAPPRAASDMDWPPQGTDKVPIRHRRGPPPGHSRTGADRVLESGSRSARRPASLPELRPPAGSRRGRVPGVHRRSPRRPPRAMAAGTAAARRPVPAAAAARPRRRQGGLAGARPDARPARSRCRGCARGAAGSTARERVTREARLMARLGDHPRHRHGLRRDRGRRRRC